jgi:cation diffusion facilitator family transporter
MDYPNTFELPEELQPVFARAKTLEWVTLVYLSTVVILMYLVMGTSQAMKAAWLEDSLSMFPAIAFLVASRIYQKPPNRKFPYGYHRAFGIAFFAGAMALFCMGSFLAIDSGITLINQVHPTIGNTVVFGKTVWMGWLMLLLLLYSAIPAMILGFRKLSVARKLHNKILFTDADTQKADYMTAFAAMLGIIGVGYGLWWADAAAALFISFSVLKDGVTSLKNAVNDLLDKYPTHVDQDSRVALIGELEDFVRSWPWVEDARVRLREHGQVYVGEIYVSVRNDEQLSRKVEERIGELKDFHWQLHDIVIVPVQTLPEFG